HEHGDLAGSVEGFAVGAEVVAAADALVEGDHAGGRHGVQARSLSVVLELFPIDGRQALGEGGAVTLGQALQVGEEVGLAVGREQVGEGEGIGLGGHGCDPWPTGPMTRPTAWNRGSFDRASAPPAQTGRTSMKRLRNWTLPATVA